MRVDSDTQAKWLFTWCQPGDTTLLLTLFVNYISRTAKREKNALKVIANSYLGSSGRRGVTDEGPTPFFSSPE